MLAVVVAAAIFLAVLLGFAGNAQAAQAFPELSKFCPTGTAGGQCERASGLATSPLDGHLFEVDTRNNRIQEFTPWGEFVKAFGWSVVASGPGNKPRNEVQQLSVIATGGTFTLRYGETSGAVPFTAAETAPIPFQPGIAPTAAQVETALVDAPDNVIGSDPFEHGDLNVSGPAGGPWTIEFVGQYTDTDFGGGQYVLEANGEGLTGGGAAATLTTAQPGGNYEICVPADGDVCRGGSPGTNPGQFGGSIGSNAGPQGIALDSSGDIYVLDRRNHRVQKYDRDGTFLLMFGGSVNGTTGEDHCTAAQVEGGNVCGAGSVGNPGPGLGEFGPWLVSGVPNIGDYLSVGPDDTVYVGDTNRIQRFGADGGFLGQIAGTVVGETVQSLDVGPDGAIYATFADTGAATNFISKPNVRRLDASGNQIAQLPVANPRGIATDSKGDVFVLDFNVTTFTSRILGFTPAGAPIDLDLNVAGNALGEGILEETTGISTTSPPTCGLETTNLSVSSYLPSSGGSNSIYLFGGAPDPAICPQPQVPPTIESQFASSVDTGSAIVKARINPRFWPDTRYFVQYGTGKCSEGGCTLTQPASPGALLTADVLNVDVLTSAVVLSGLESGTTYHFRFVAQSGGGSATGEELTLRTARAAGTEAGCPNDAFRTGASAALPDCRAYELVSPLDKASGGDIARSTEYSLIQADPAGQRMTFSSPRSFAGPEGAPLIGQFLATRQSGGWSTASISPPRSALSLYPLGAATEGNFFKALSADLCSGWVVQDSALALTGDAPAGVPNLYRRDNCGSGYELLTSTLPPGFGPVPYDSLYFPTVQGFSADASRTVFRANAPLAVSPGGPRPPFTCSAIDPDGTVAYRWLRDGAPIGGATNPTYTSVAADVGKTLQCQVTTTASGRTSLVASETMLVAPVPATEPPNPGFKPPSAANLPGAPAIAGTPTVGSTLTCGPGPWNGSPSFSYQWLRDGALIGGATAQTYVPVPADEGASIQCRATGTNAGGAAISFSRSVTVAASLPFATALPTLTGTPEAGQTLTCDKGTWQNATTFAYQWLRNGATIGGATTDQYTLVAADEGKAIQCRVDAVNSEATVAATSSRLVVAPPPGTAPPSRLAASGITGTPEIGEILTCDEGTWQGASTFSYQWLRNGAVIGGATTDEYTLTAADEGKAIQCQVSAPNAGGTVVAIDGDQESAVYAAPPAAPRTVVSTTEGNSQLYVSSGSTLRLVSVLPNGAATTDSTTVGTSWSLTPLASNSREDAVYRAVSEDGSRVFWSATSGVTPEGSGTGAGILYLRLNAPEPQSAISGGKCTEAAKACTVPVSASDEARFVSANPQGSRVVYMTGKADPLVGLQLFTGEVDVSGSEPTVNSELLAAGVRGVVGVSEDASRIYFVSREALTSDVNSEGDEAVAGQPNLYFYEAGSALDFVATLGEADAREGETRPGQLSPPTSVSVTPNRRTSRVTPDGLHVAFTATAAPTGHDNADAASGEPNAEVFIYDAAADGGEGRLLCASCNPSGARPAGRLVHSGIAGTEDDVWAAAMVPGWNSQFQPTRALSDNGRRLYFNAYAPLVPGDSNGRADVYQWEAPGAGSCTEASPSFSESNGGCVRLISSGQSAEDAEFFDATPSGSDVFFLTQASLVPDDYGLRDVYDARVNGGFAPRSPAGQGCQGDACQSPPAPPQNTTPSSSTFSGQGNVKEATPRPRCPKGRSKARRNGRTVCVKNRKPKAKKQGKKRAGSAKKGGTR